MGFENCHPLVNFIYFAVMLYATVNFRHPVFLAISFLCAFAYSIKRNGKRALVFNLALLTPIVAFALYYSSYTHFGITVLAENFIGNSITLESLVYGAVLAVSFGGVIMWLSCLYSVFSADKIIYLFGKISPKAAMLLSILLRMAPRIKNGAERLNTAQCSIGRGVNCGGVIFRLKNCIRIFSALVTQTLDSLISVSESMQSRGSTLRGRKAFSVYRFDNRDRAYVICMFSLITLTAMGVQLNQTDIVCDPKIIINPTTASSYVFYTAYAALCLMPLVLELWTQYRFKKARKNTDVYPQNAE